MGLTLYVAKLYRGRNANANRGKLLDKLAGQNERIKNNAALGYTHVKYTMKINKILRIFKGCVMSWLHHMSQ